MPVLAPCGSNCLVLECYALGFVNAICLLQDALLKSWWL